MAPFSSSYPETVQFNRCRYARLFIGSQSVSVSVSIHIMANNALRAHHASAHGGLSANGLSDICLSIFEMILSNCLKLCLTVEHSIL